MRFNAAPKPRRDRFPHARPLVGVKESIVSGSTPPPNTSFLRPTLLVQRERAQKAYMMRVEGYTLSHIAEELGYGSIKSAREAILRVMKRNEADTVSDARLYANERVEAVIRVLWPEVQAGKLSAIDRFLRAVALHARINGVVMDNPTQINVEAVMNSVPAVTILPQNVDYRAAMRPILTASQDVPPYVHDLAPLVIDGDFAVAGSEAGPERDS